MDIGPPSFWDSPVCSSGSMGWSMVVGESVGWGWLLCQAVISASTLAGSVRSNHHLRMADSRSRSRAGLPKRISPFLP